MGRSGTARPKLSAKQISASPYSRWAPIYDLIFDLPFHPGRSAAAKAAAAEAAGKDGEVLVVGVGTGLELGLLPKSLRITGIDLSAPMLKIARERVAKEALGQVKALHIMDAARARISRRAVRRRARALCDERRPGAGPRARRNVARVAPGRPDGADEPFLGRAGLARQNGGGAREIGGLARLASAISPMPRSATGSRPVRTPQFSSAAKSRRSGCSPCCEFERPLRRFRNSDPLRLSSTERLRPKLCAMI